MTYVYFIRAIDNTGPIKIGSSYLPARRLAQMNCWSPIPLALLAKVDGDEFYERALHDKFHAHRMHGEWFAPSPDLVSFVERVIAGESLADLGIEPSRVSTRVHKSEATRMKQSVTLRLNWAIRRATEGKSYDHYQHAENLPDDVLAAVKCWTESTDVRLLTKQRQIIEAHIAHLKGQAA